MIVFVVGVISLKYSVEGEINLPFGLSKISVISTDIEDGVNKWNLQVNQNNDIYLYIKKNDNYKETEAIENIKLDNFNLQKSSNIGNIKLFKPDSNVESVNYAKLVSPITLSITKKIEGYKCVVNDLTLSQTGKDDVK